MKYQISEKDGFLTMDDLPHNCIFNKVRTGCGGTSIVLNNAENYVVAVPTTELIINKCQNPNAGLSPSRNLFGLYGTMTKGLEEDLLAYVKGTGVKKIMCTYDKVPKLTTLIQPKEFRLLVDEYHDLLKQYSFRTKAINGVLDSFKQFKSYCFLSATPIEHEFKPDALNGIPELEAEWKEDLQIKIAPYATNKPYQFVCNIIDAYKQDGFISLNDQKSEEAYFFLNSVKEISKIIKSCKLTNDECRVICADKSENKKQLSDICISNSISKNKRFNFITCKSFEGADYFSSTGLCFVVSNANIKHTLTSIDLDIPQIAGRIRTKNNPFKNMIVHIFNTVNNDLFNDYDSVKVDALKEIEIAKERVDAYNNLSKEAKEQQVKDIKDSLYIRFNQGRFEVNDLIIKYHLYEYKLSHQIYASIGNIKKEYQNVGVNQGKINWVKLDTKQISSKGKSPSIKEIVKKYHELQFSFGDSRSEMEHKYPFIKEAFMMFSYDELLKFRSRKALEGAILEAQLNKFPDKNERFKLIQPEIEVGRFYRTDELKTICQKYNFKKISELKERYNLKSGTKRVNGKVCSGYWIRSLKMTPE